MKTSASQYRKENLWDVHPDWRLAASDDVAAVTSMSRHLHRKEINMQEMTNFPIELSSAELDLVAAGCNSCSRGGSTYYGGNGNNVFQAGLINLNDVASNDNVNISLLSGVSQGTGGG
jgi:hypothetical protein